MQNISARLNSKVLLSIATIFAAAAIVLGATFAFFSDTETSKDNTFVAGALDLKVNGEDDPSQIVNITDLKPGDDYLIDKTLLVDFNPAKIYVHIKDIVNNQGTQTEPENLEEDNTPKSDIQNFLTYDLKVQDEVIISFQNNVLLPDAVSCWIPLGQIPGNQNVTVTQSFHFDEDVTNWAQGDILTFTEEFLALQINDPTIPTTGENVWNPDTKRCEPPPVIVSCEPNDAIFASGFSNVAQGLRKDGTAVLADRSDPNDATGAPQSLGNPDDTPVVAGSFFSLGFPHANNGNVPGTLELSFSEPFFPNPSGSDLQVFEVTGGTYPEERVRVEVSPDGTTWTLVAASALRDAPIEISPLTSAQFIRLTEASNIAPFESTADGYDLDAVKAFCTEAD